jgi:hypothetical protein
VVSKYIPEALEAGCKVKVLFLSPESKQVAYRAHHLGRRTEDRLRTQILNELTDLVDMCKDDPDLDLTVKVYDAAPVFHMFDFGRTKLIGPCWRLERSVWGTQFEIQEKTPLAKLVNNHFDDLWDDRRLFNGKHVTEEASKVLDRLAEKDKKPPPEKDKKPPPEKDKKPPPEKDKKPLRGF